MKILLYSLVGIFIFSFFIVISILLIPFYLILNLIQLIVWGVMLLLGKSTYRSQFSRPRFIYKTYKYSNDKEHNNNSKYKVIDMEDE